MSSNNYQQNFVSSGFESAEMNPRKRSHSSNTSCFHVDNDETIPKPQKIRCDPSMLSVKITASSSHQTINKGLMRDPRLKTSSHPVVEKLSKKPIDPTIFESAKKALSILADNTRVPGKELGNQASPKAMKTFNDTIKSETYSSFALKQMSKMGHIPGKGLGKSQQGVAEPVEVRATKGTRGLGHVLPGFDILPTHWDFKEVSTEPDVRWMPSCSTTISSLKELETWVEYDSPKFNISDETHFVSENVLSSVLSCKSILDVLEGREMMNARTRSNPFEIIRGAIFQNRAAMKMAEIDATFSFCFSTPSSNTIEKNSRSPNLGPPTLYFADICAGPGGFSEYILWRRKWRCKGFGFTLKGDCDFALQKFKVGSSEFFEPHYGVGGLDGSGNIYSSENLIEFRDFVRQRSNGGVHMVMADGGFSVAGKENIQEIMSKRLYLCQFLCALSLLRPGGNFMCKLFDCFTPFSVSLIYLIRQCFQRVTIFKPFTSRPANSERFLVALELTKAVDDSSQIFSGGNGTFSTLDEENLNIVSAIYDHLFRINKEMEEWMIKCGLHPNAIRGSEINSRRDIVTLVPLNVMEGDVDFFDYIFEMNRRIGESQVESLRKLSIFAKNETLSEPNQHEIREILLQRWEIPNQTRDSAFLENDPVQENSPSYIINKLIRSYVQKIPFILPNARSIDVNFYTANSLIDAFNNGFTVINSENIKHLLSLLNYRFVVSGAQSPEDHFLLLSRGGRFLHKYDFTSNLWRPLPSALINVEVPRDTLLEVELVRERRGEGKGMTQQWSLHVIDALILNGECVFHLDPLSRFSLADEFCNNLRRDTRMDLAPIHTKLIYKLGEDFESFLHANIQEIMLKGDRQKTTCYQFYSNNLKTPSEIEKRFFPITGIYLISTAPVDWTIEWSKGLQKKYCYNCKTRFSGDNFGDSVLPDFIDTTKLRLYLQWCKKPTTSINVSTPMNSLFDIENFKEFHRQKMKLLMAKGFKPS